MNIPYAIMPRMDNRTGFIIVILLGLLGAFLSYRAGTRSLQVSRRQASWPERRRQRAAGWRYFGLAIILVILAIAGLASIPKVWASQLASLASPSASPGRTATTGSLQTQTNTLFWTTTPAPTQISTSTVTPVPSFTGTSTPHYGYAPTDTPLPTFTPSITRTATITPSPTRTPTATNTYPATRTPIPTDTRWLVPLFPSETPSPTDTPWLVPLFPSDTPLPTDTPWPHLTPTATQ